MDKMPKWADVVLVPVVSLFLAALISIIVFVAVGQNPWEALSLMAYGAVGTSDFLGYTLFYATNFIFTALRWPSPFTPRCLTLAAKDRFCWAVWGRRLSVCSCPGPIGRWR